MKNITFLFFFIISFSFAQNYVALDTADYAKRTDLIKKIDTDFEAIKKTLKSKHKSKTRKLITTSYFKLFENLKKDVTKKRLVFHPIFKNYIDSLTQIIIKNNPNYLKDDLNVYITKHNSPNALSMGSGYILLNMGLFKYLDNEAQLVSVLSHEIAHQVLQHSKKSILEHAHLETSTQTKEEAKRIKKQKYNKQSEAFAAFKDILFANKKKNRIQEIQADSIGFLLFKNTSYSPKSFLNALSVLAELDSLPSIALKKDTYKKFFNIPEQPFNNDWLKIENFNNYNYNHFKEKINTDSLKSHPEILERIDRIKTNFSNELNNNSKQTKTSSKFIELQKIARYEDVANLSYTQQYGLSIYLTLSRLEKKPDDSYYKKWLGINFNKLYEAKKKYQFNRHVDKLIPDEQDESYQQFLSFLWNLRLNEIKAIADYYDK